MRTPTQAVVLDSYRQHRARGLRPLDAAELVRGEISTRMIRTVLRGGNPTRVERDRFRAADQHVATVALLTDLRGERPSLSLVRLTNSLRAANREAVSA
jgi:hypothetical protein